MKRSITQAIKHSSILAIIVLALVSCDTKACKCYNYNGASQPYMDTEYVSDGTSCSALDRSSGHTYRVCLEYNEQEIDPGQIGQEYKK